MATYSTSPEIDAAQTSSANVATGGTILTMASGKYAIVHLSAPVNSNFYLDGLLCAVVTANTASGPIYIGPGQVLTITFGGGGTQTGTAAGVRFANP